MDSESSRKEGWETGFQRVSLGMWKFKICEASPVCWDCHRPLPQEDLDASASAIHCWPINICLFWSYLEGGIPISISRFFICFTTIMADIQSLQQHGVKVRCFTGLALLHFQCLYLPIVRSLEAQSTTWWISAPAIIISQVAWIAISLQWIVSWLQFLLVAYTFIWRRLKSCNFIAISLQEM